jgi:hypothetical protein
MVDIIIKDYGKNETDNQTVVKLFDNQTVVKLLFSILDEQRKINSKLDSILYGQEKVEDTDELNVSESDEYDDYSRVSNKMDENRDIMRRALEGLNDIAHDGDDL